MKVTLPVTWSVCGDVVVEAASIEDAVERFDELTDDVPLPDNPDYVDGSFELSTDDLACLQTCQPRRR
jgi:hypothetical protein